MGALNFFRKIREEATVTAQSSEIKNEAAKSYDLRMQSLGFLPPWIQTAREEEREKIKLGLKDKPPSPGGGGERGG